MVVSQPVVVVFTQEMIYFSL